MKLRKFGNRSDQRCPIKPINSLSTISQKYPPPICFIGICGFKSIETFLVFHWCCGLLLAGTVDAEGANIYLFATVFHKSQTAKSDGKICRWLNPNVQPRLLFQFDAETSSKFQQLALVSIFPAGTAEGSPPAGRWCKTAAFYQIGWSRSRGNRVSYHGF